MVNVTLHFSDGSTKSVAATECPEPSFPGETELPPATATKPDSNQIPDQGGPGPHYYSYGSGELPPLGLSVSGLMSGTPPADKARDGAYVFSVNLLRSRSGRAFMAIRDNEIAASAMGINVALYKTLAFGVSAGITGIAGGLGAIAVQFVAPDGYTITLAISLFLGMVVGGVGWLPGSIVGSAFIIFVPNIAEGISKGLSGAVFGVILFLVIFLVPHGARQVALVAQHLLGAVRRRSRRVRANRRRS